MVLNRGWCCRCVVDGVGNQSVDDSPRINPGDSKETYVPPESSVFVASDLLRVFDLSDSVGLTLLYRLVFCSLLGAIYSAMEVMFTRFIELEAINPIHLPFGQSLSAYFGSFSYNAV